MKMNWHLVRKISGFVLAFTMFMSVSLPAFAQEIRTNIPQSKDQTFELSELSPYMAIDEKGLFTLDYNRALLSANVSEETLEWVSQDISRINKHLEDLPREERPYVIETKDGVQIEWSINLLDCEDNYLTTNCTHVPRWVLDTIGWTGIIYGAGVVTVGLFISGTIVGIPVGAIFQALGLWNGVAGTFLLWIVAEYYPNGVWVCW